MSTVAATDKHYTARIIERRDLSEDLWLIRVDPAGPFQFKAGQYATLGATKTSESSEHIPLSRHRTSKDWNFLSNSCHRVRSRPISTDCSWATPCCAAKSPRAASRWT